MQKQTITEMLKQKKQLERQIAVTLDAARDDEAVLLARQVLEKAKDIARKAAQRKAAPLQEELEALTTEVQERQAKNKQVPLEIPGHILEWLTDIKKGTDYGPVEFKISWLSKTERFFILTWPGHETWAGLGSFQYTPTEHYLMDIDKAVDCGYTGSSLFDIVKVNTCEGRLTKAIKEEWMAKALEMEAADVE